MWREKEAKRIEEDRARLRACTAGKGEVDRSARRSSRMRRTTERSYHSRQCHVDRAVGGKTAVLMWREWVDRTGRTRGTSSAGLLSHRRTRGSFCRPTSSTAPHSRCFHLSSRRCRHRRCTDRENCEFVALSIANAGSDAVCIDLVARIALGGNFGHSVSFVRRSIGRRRIGTATSRFGDAVECGGREGQCSAWRRCSPS